MLLATLAFLLTVRTSAAQNQRAPTRGGTLVVAGVNDLQNMNSLVNNDVWTTDVINHLLFLPLLRFNPDLSFAPALAESWRVIGDTAVLFRIRRDVRWHDGARTTAHDVAFTFDRIKDPTTAFPHPKRFALWQSAEVIDSFTIRFRMKPHVEPFVGWATTSVMPKHLLDSVPPAHMRQTVFNKRPVGNGPFRFVSQQGNDRWVFAANAGFPRALGGRPHLDRVVWRVVPDNSAQTTAFLTGEVDIALGLRGEQVSQLNQRPQHRVILRPSHRYAAIIWNWDRPPLNDARVRRALTMAMNRQQMIDVVRSGLAEIAASPIPPDHWAHDKALEPLPYDTAGARRLLAAAGYTRRNRDGVLQNTAGKPLELELMVPANIQVQRDIGELVRSALSAIGVNLVVRPTDWAVMLQAIAPDKRDFDAVFLAPGNDFRLSYSDEFHSRAPGTYANAELDDLLDRSEIVTDRAGATRIWQRVQRILRDDQPFTFLWWAPEIIGVRTRVNGVEMDARGAFRTLPQWWLTGK